MKVLFATPYSNHAGGINQWAKHITRYHKYIQSDIELDILPMNDPKDSDRSKHHSLMNRILYGIRTYTNVARNLKSSIKGKQYDILHLSSSASISLLKDIWLMRIAHRNGIKSILHLHFGRIPELYEKQNWEWKLLKRAIKMSHTCIVLDNKSYTTLINNGFNNITQLANPLAPQVEQIIQQSSDITRDPNTILFVGHCVATKGIYELITACSKIPNIKVNIVGPIHDDIKAELEHITNKASWLEIKGQCDLETVIKEMLGCGIFVLPTYTEGFPNVIIESMACGCAIITTTVGAIPEILEAEEGKAFGIMIEPRNTEQLIDAIQKMISDSIFMKNCQTNVRNRVKERYNIDSIWQQITMIWSNCAKL